MLQGGKQHQQDPAERQGLLGLCILPQMEGGTAKEKVMAAAMIQGLERSQRNMLPDS